MSRRVWLPCLKVSTRERLLTVSEKRSPFGISIFLFRRLDSTIWPTATIMAVQSPNLMIFPFLNFLGNFSYYIIPMGWESGNRDRGNVGLLRRRTIFGRKSNESDSRSIISVSSLWPRYASEGDEERKRTRPSLIPGERRRVDSEGPRKSFWLLD